MTRPLHVVFAGGGTPGHLFPGLAVAAHVVKHLPGATVTFVGTGKSLARHVVRAAGFHYANVPCQAAPEGPLRAVRFVTDNVAGYWASRWLLKEQLVSLVVGLGGYASAATVSAAMARGIPTLLLEQNVVPGRVTRWLAPAATTVCAGFAATRAELPPTVSLIVTGNAARPAFEQLYRRRQTEPAAAADPADGPPRARRLLVIGGAGGARSLNQFMPGALVRMGGLTDDWQIIHQSGEGQLQETISRYRDAGVDALVVACVDDLAPVMFESDLVMCRAGGTTLAELALAGVPAVLIPYPLATDANQLANAKVIAKAGAATVIDETALDGTLDEALAGKLLPLLTGDEKRTAMAERMRSLARPDAAAHITTAIQDILCAAPARLAA